MAIKDSVTQVQETLRDERNSVRRFTERTEEVLAQVVRQLDEIEGKLIPDFVVGMLRNYKYGASSGDPHPSGGRNMPTHRFDLECGQQVWLHIVNGSDKWDEFIQNLQPEFQERMEDMSIAEALEGVRIVVKRDSAYDRFIPVRALSATQVGTDANGAAVYDGDVVQVNDGNSYKLTVKGAYLPDTYDVKRNPYLQGCRDDGEFGGGDYDEEYGGELYVVDRAYCTVQPVPILEAA